YEKGADIVRPLGIHCCQPVQRNFFVGCACLSITFGSMSKPVLLPFVLLEPAPGELVPLTGPGAESAVELSSSADDRALVSVGTEGRDLNIPNIFPRMLLSSCCVRCASSKATGFGWGIG